MFPLPVSCLPQSGRTRVIADSEHVPLRQQNPRNPAVSMTTHTPAYTTVKFQLPVDLLPDCCQSPWWGRERQAIPPGCCRVSWLPSLFIIKYSWLHPMSCLDTHNSFLQTSGHTTTFFFPAGLKMQRSNKVKAVKEEQKQQIEMKRIIKC